MLRAPDVRLGQLIREQGWVGLLVVGQDGREADLCRFTRGRRLGLTCVWVAADGRARLVYFSDMERDEVAATGVEHLGPHELGLTGLRRETNSTGEFVARTALRLARQLGTSAGEVGLAGRLPAGDLLELSAALHQRNWRLASANRALSSWRRRKEDFEVDSARKAAEVTCEAFLRVAGELRRASQDRLTVADLRRVIALHFAEHGLEQPRGNIVAGGKASAVPHSTGDSDSRLRAGETVVIDLFPRDLLYADCSRTFCLPPIPKMVEEAHAVVRSSLEAASREAVAGTPIGKLVDSALTVIEDAGYPTLRLDGSTRRGMVHSLGHGIGYDLHEQPSLRPGTKGDLAAGDLLTIEPGVYDPEAGWGIRLEDMLLLDGRGDTHNLTPLPYDLDPAAWPIRE